MVLFLGPMATIVASALELRMPFTTALHRLLIEKGMPLTLDVRRWPVDKVRDLALGPFAEEVVYRALVVPYLLAAGMSPLKTVFMAPTFFGFAHIHHAINSIRGGESVGRTALVTTFQFSYTYLFGLYCTYALLVTNCLLGPIMCHCFCNFMSLPDLDFHSNPHHRAHAYKNAIWGAYAVGIAGFILGFYVLGHVRDGDLIYLINEK
jgi:prenyl protein peptidase